MENDNGNGGGGMGIVGLNPPLYHRPPYDYLFKVIVIGDSGVGKTNLTLRFCEGFFMHDYLGTIGIDFKVKTVEVDGRRIKLQIWDTAGQERFQTITQVYYRGSHGVLYIYDITNRLSFDHLITWMRTFDSVTACATRKLIVGNKADLAMTEGMRKIAYEEADLLAKSINCKFMEASAKTGYNVENVFKALAKEIKDQQESIPLQLRHPSTMQMKKSDKKLKKTKSFFYRCNLL